jgi:pilus assembly protein CpaE
VVNFTDSRSGLQLSDVEATIGAKVDVALPRARSVPASVDVGVPLLQAGRNDKATKQLRTLVKGLLAGSPVDRAEPLPRSRRFRRSVPAPRRAAHRWLAPVRSAS